MTAPSATIAEYPFFAIFLHNRGISKAPGTQTTSIFSSLTPWRINASSAPDNSFEPIIAFGKNAADPHHSNDDSKIQKFDSIIIDMGCKYQGYCSDMTRTVFYGGITEKQMEVYELVKQANEAAEKIIRPGIKLADIDKCARDIIAKAGYGEYFNHRLGHFIGRDVHEYGDVSQSFDMKVEAGMIFSIEPGVYLPGEFGVRVEDLVLVTEDGCQVLNSYAKDIQIL